MRSLRSSKCLKTTVKLMFTPKKASDCVFCFRLEIPFLCEIGPKIQNYQFKRNFGIKTNLNMRNSMMMFTFSVFDRKYRWANLVQNFGPEI